MPWNRLVSALHSLPLRLVEMFFRFSFFVPPSPPPDALGYRHGRGGTPNGVSGHDAPGGLVAGGNTAGRSAEGRGRGRECEFCVSEFRAWRCTTAVPRFSSQVGVTVAVAGRSITLEDSSWGGSTVGIVSWRRGGGVSLGVSKQLTLYFFHGRGGGACAQAVNRLEFFSSSTPRNVMGVCPRNSSGRGLIFRPISANMARL